MYECDLIFIREDLFKDDPSRKVIIATFREPPAAGDYLIVDEEVKMNTWAKEIDEEFMDIIAGETYVFKERIYARDKIMFNLEKFDTSRSRGGFLNKLGG